MTTTTQANRPLRQRMIDDMRMRKLSTKTQDGYIRFPAKVPTARRHGACPSVRSMTVGRHGLLTANRSPNAMNGAH